MSDNERTKYINSITNEILKNTKETVSHSLNDNYPEKRPVFISFSGKKQGFYVSTTNSEYYAGRISLIDFHNLIIDEINDANGDNFEDLYVLADFFEQLSNELRSGMDKFNEDKK